MQLNIFGRQKNHIIMEYNVISIRPFIGTRNFGEARAFYTELGFTETRLEKMSLFQKGKIGFYLQDAYVKEWVDNTMVFVEVENVEQVYDTFFHLNIKVKYPTAKL